MNNLLSNLSSTLDESSIVVLVILLVIIFILRGLLRHYVSSKIMCIIFSIITVVLTIIVMINHNIGGLGPWIFYTTFSTYMYSYGPEVFVTGFTDRYEIKYSFFSSFVTIERERTGGIFVYLFSGLGLTFLVVNIIGYQSGLVPIYFVIPFICMITSIVGLIRYYR